MNNKFKKILIFLLILPIMLICSACVNTPNIYITSVEKTGSNLNYDTYTITYNNGSTYNFSVKNGTDGANGENGNDLQILDVYNEAVNQGFTGNFLDFLETYLSAEVPSSETQVINNALFSTVSIFCKFTSLEGDAYSSAGSGIFYSLDKTTGSAYVVTNYHVVYNGSSATENKISDDIGVYLYGNQYTDYTIPASYVGGTMDYDLAVLKIENNDFLKNSDARAVTFENSNNIKVGESAIAVGNPEAKGLSATKGIVSVDSEYVSMLSVDESEVISMRLLRIDTAINSGNSGGGLYDSNGKLIGIVNAKSTVQNIDNIGYAIPSNVVKAVAQNIIDNGGNLKRFLMGIEMQIDSTSGYFDEATQSAKIKEEIKIKSITENSIAYNLGMQVDDKLVSFYIGDSFYEINRMFEIIDGFMNARENTIVRINVLRGEQEIQFSYTVLAENLVIIN